MSRQIDLTKPLSDEDRAYLQARNRKRDIAIADGNAEQWSGLPDDSITSSTDRSPSAIPAAQAAQITDGAPAADSPLASPATDHTTEATQTGEADESKQDAASDADSASSGEDEGDNYDDETVWSYDDLKEEVKGREAEDSPALNSKREDLITWLRADDARPDATDAS